MSHSIHMQSLQIDAFGISSITSNYPSLPAIIQALYGYQIQYYYCIVGQNVAPNQPAPCMTLLQGGACYYAFTLKTGWKKGAFSLYCVMLVKLQLMSRETSYNSFCVLPEKCLCCCFSYGFFFCSLKRAARLLCLKQQKNFDML